MKKKDILLVMVGLLIVLASVGVTYTFFNYTRTGGSNTVKVGRIYFNSTQDNTINLTNVFPISASDALTDNTNSSEVVITINGDTTYSKGIEYLVTLEDVNTSINANKNVPVGIMVIPEKTGELGTSDEDYFTNHGGNTSIYKSLIEESDILDNGKYVFVGYIRPGAAEVNGTIAIRAFIDEDSIAITDTPDENVEWQRGRTILTTSEWNALQTNGLSFKVKVEANEGIWVGDPTSRNDMKQIPSTVDRSSVTEINFIRMGEEMINEHADLIDLTEEDGSGIVKGWIENNKLYIASPGVIYFPQDSNSFFADFSNVSKINFNNINTSEVTGMLSFFSGCSSLTSVDLSSFDTSNIHSFDKFFYGCESLQNLDLSSLDVSRGVNFWAVFQNCTNLVNLNLSGWNTANVLNTSFMFDACENLTNVDLSGFNMDVSANLSGMFRNCKDMTMIDLTGMKGNQIICMFYGCENLQTVILKNAVVSGTNVNAWGLFYDCVNLQTVDLTNVTIGSIGDGGQMFSNCSSLLSVDLSGFTFDSSGRLESAFHNCTSLTNVTFDSITTGNIKCMFEGCENLERVNYNHFIVTSSGLDLYNVFYNCYKLQSLDLSEFNITAIKDARCMFMNCKLLESVQINGFNFASNASLYGMFSGCEKLTSLDLSSFNIGNSNNTNNMFSYCKKLKTIYVSNLWTATTYSDSSYMFGQCAELVGGAGTSFNWNNPNDGTYGHVDGGTSNPGYFTLKTT